VTAPQESRVRQLRLVVETEDFEAAVAFYRDVLGRPVELDLLVDRGEHVVILEAGRATRSRAVTPRDVPYWLRHNAAERRRAACSLLCDPPTVRWSAAELFYLWT
jgi:catechol 2,3-dioxygenase-like lactoylglutathione lyase family enzyme